MDDAGGDVTAAVGHLRKDDFAAARPLLERAVAADPCDAVAEAYLGMTLFHLQDVDGAKTHLDLAVALDPDEFLTWAKRGEFWLLLACYPQAIADFKAALRLEPPTGGSRRWVARLLEEAQQRSKTSFVRTAVAPSWRLPWRLSWRRLTGGWRRPDGGHEAAPSPGAAG